MQTQTNSGGVASYLLLAGIVLILLNGYYFTYGVWEGMGLSCGITDRFLTAFARTGVFRRPFVPQSLAILLLLVSQVRSGKANPGRGSVKCAIIGMITGLGLFFGSLLMLSLAGNPAVACGMYFGMEFIGMGMVLWAEGRLFGLWKARLETGKRFGEAEAGFPQETRKLNSAFALTLRARYLYKGRWQPSRINVVNPRRGIMILGNPGSGKSRFLIEPMIRQLVEKGMALFVYDFKFDTLTNHTWQLFQQYRDRYPPETKFYVIHFDKARYSHRCNLLEPRLLESLSDAIDASRTILLSLNRSWVHQQGEFFIESAINFVSALIWHLRGLEGGRYCTLPHVIELAQTPLHRLLPLLAGEGEIASLVQTFVDAYNNKAMEMLSGQIAGATIALARLAAPDIYYVLTGNDLSLEINDPAAPCILCLGGDPVRQEALAPVISLYIDRLNRRVNQAGRHPCAMVCDEFGTVRAYSIATTIATGRSNNIIPVLAVQDISQLRLRYSRDEADLLLNVSGNLFCGQVGGETARWVSERFPQVLQERGSVSRNSRDTTVSQSDRWEDAIRPATIANLSAGEFVGVLADDPGREMRLKAFHARVEMEDISEGWGSGWDGGRVGVDAEEVERNFYRVKEEVRRVVMGKG